MCPKFGISSPGRKRNRHHKCNVCHGVGRTMSPYLWGCQLLHLFPRYTKAVSIPSPITQLISLSINMAYSSAFHYAGALEHIMWHSLSGTKDFKQAVGKIYISFYNLGLLLNTKNRGFQGAILNSLRLKIDRPVLYERFVLNILCLEVPPHSSFDSSYSVIVRSSRASKVDNIRSLSSYRYLT